jgi:hypothetical protein
LLEKKKNGYLKGYFLDIQKLFLKDQDYFDKKFEDHRAISILLIVIYSFLGPSLWIWDHITDPIGAQNTIFFRISFSTFAHKT